MTMISGLIVCLGLLGGFILIVTVGKLLFDFAYRRFPSFREEIDALTANSVDWDL